MAIFSMILLSLSLFSELASSERSFTSVWCQGSHQDHRHCSFRNLCFSPYYQQFVFFHSPSSSSFSGIDDPHEQRNMAKLSPLIGGNQFYFDYVMLPEEARANFSVTQIGKPTLILSRWKPNHLLHAFHDDILPIYATLRHLCLGDIPKCAERFQLAIIGPKSRYDQLDQILSNHPILFLHKPLQSLEKRSSLMCFDESMIGLDTETLWYDHGLQGHQKSIDNFQLKPSFFEEFRHFVLKRLRRNPRIKAKDIVVVYSDQTNQISNPHELEQELRGFFPGECGTFDLEKDQITDIIDAVSDCKIFVAFHGAAPSLALFAPKSAIILEVFPFGLHPETFSFTKSLARLQGNHYDAHIIHQVSLTQTFPNRAPKFGGIAHLDHNLQHSIEDLEYVDNVGYNDPAYLYRLHQKSTIDPIELRELLKNIVEDLNASSSSNAIEDTPLLWMFPSKVFDIRCKVLDNVVEVSWEAPLNLAFIPHKNLIYEVLVENEGMDPSQGILSSRDFSTQENRISIQDQINFRTTKGLKLWITPVLDLDQRGPETFGACDFSDYDL